MDSATRFLILLIALLGGGARACELDGSHEERERDLRFQELLVEKAASEAEVIVFGTVSEIRRPSLARGRQPTFVEFAVEEWLKVPIEVQDKRHLVLKADLLVTSTICLPSDKFYEDQVTVGEVVVVYGKSGKVLRAAATNRGKGEIIYEREIELLRNRVGP